MPFHTIISLSTANVSPPRPKMAGFLLPKTEPLRMRMTELNKSIADMIDAGDDHFEFASAESVGEAAGAENASPRAWGFDVENQP